MIITRQLLEELRFPKDQIKLFAREWPKGMEMNYISERRSGSIGFDYARLKSKIGMDNPRPGLFGALIEDDINGSGETVRQVLWRGERTTLIIAPPRPKTGGSV